MGRIYHAVLHVFLFLIFTGAPHASAQTQQWSDAGEALFTDGWISPLYTGKAECFAVRAQISTDGCRVRLVEPYASPAFSSIAGEDTVLWGEGRYITFDITDPQWVRILPAEAVCLPAGAAGASSQSLWPTSRGEHMHALGYTREAITGAGLNSVYEDMVISIPQGMVSFGPGPDDLTQSFADMPLTVSVELSGASVSAVHADACTENVLPEYFTLSGLPVRGSLVPGIYIVKTGEVVTKTAVR